MKDLLLLALKKELFYCNIEFDRDIDANLLVEIFILIDKYYGGYKIGEKFGEGKKKWDNFNLTDKIKNGNLKLDKFRFYLIASNHA